MIGPILNQMDQYFTRSRRVGSQNTRPAVQCFPAITLGSRRIKHLHTCIYTTSTHAQSCTLKFFHFHLFIFHFLHQSHTDMPTFAPRRPSPSADPTSETGVTATPRKTRLRSDSDASRGSPLRKSPRLDKQGSPNGSPKIDVSSLTLSSFMLLSSLLIL